MEHLATLKRAVAVQLKRWDGTPWNTTVNVVQYSERIGTLYVCTGLARHDKDGVTWLVSAGDEAATGNAGPWKLTIPETNIEGVQDL